MFKRKLKPICRNCVLFAPEQHICKVVILNEGERMNIPVDADDPCFFKNKFIALKNDGQKEQFQPEIDQVRWWVEDPKTGEAAENGIVKVQFPKDFFGKD
jgi:hypothetical protein